jgi:hypothetical protein
MDAKGGFALQFYLARPMVNLLNATVNHGVESL